MQTRATRHLAQATTALVLLAGCGAADGSPAEVGRSALPEVGTDTNVPATTTVVPTTTAASDIEIDEAAVEDRTEDAVSNTVADPAERWTSDRCNIELRTIETAVEAHVAQYDESPGSVQALVDTGMLLDVSEAYEVTEIDTVVEVAGGPCEDGGRDAPETDPEDGSEFGESGDPLTAPCWIETLAVEVLSNVHEAETGMALTDVQTLIDTGWTSLALGGVALDDTGATAAVDDALCQPVLRTDSWVLDEVGSLECVESIARISIALEARDTLLGVQRTTTADLTGLGYLDDGSLLHDYERGLFTPRDPGRCNPYGTEDPDPCDVERRTLDTAVEAYYAQEGADVASLQELVDGGYLRDDLGNWTLTPSTDGVSAPQLTPTPGADCDR